MTQLPDEYELSERDIDKMLNWLRIFDPENATPEQAIAFLTDARISIHKYAHDKPEKLEELYKKFKERQR
jgi:hypothetical protein